MKIHEAPYYDCLFDFCKKIYKFIKTKNSDDLVIDGIKDVYFYEKPSMNLGYYIKTIDENRFSLKFLHGSDEEIFETTPISFSYETLNLMLPKVLAGALHRIIQKRS